MDFFKVLNGFSPFFGGKEIYKEELEATSPAIFITPVAVYR